MHTCVHAHTIIHTYTQYRKSGNWLCFYMSCLYKACWPIDLHWLSLGFGNFNQETTRGWRARWVCGCGGWWLSDEENMNTWMSETAGNTSQTRDADTSLMHSDRTWGLWEATWEGSVKASEARVRGDREFPGPTCCSPYLWVRKSCTVSFHLTIKAI